MEEVEDGFLAEQIPQFLAVNVGLALLGAAVGGNDEDFGVWFAVFDKLDPFFDKTLLRAFARLPDDEVDGGGTEKKLVGGTINTLTTKIPAVEGDFCAADRVNGGDGSYFDAVRGGVFLPRFAF